MLLGVAMLVLPLGVVGAATSPIVAPASSPIVAPASSPIVNSSSNTDNGCTPGTLCNPLKFNTVCGLVTGLLDAVMIIGIPIAVLFIVWAGFKFVLAQGNPGELTEARSNFLNVIIGIGIFVGASLIAAIIINTLKELGVSGISSC